MNATEHGSPGSIRELLKLSIPLILSNSFLTVQLCLDRIFLTWNGNDDAAASMPAVMLFSTLIGLFSQTIQYTSVFVSQYISVQRHERVGPVVWQAMRLAVVAGVLFLGLIPLSTTLFAVWGHAPEVVASESAYFRSLCLAALPSLVVAVVNAFFAGRGSTWTVLVINAIGLGINAPLAYGWILGEWGMPKLGSAGAGYATLCGSTASMVVGLGLLLRGQFEAVFRTRSGWCFDFALSQRLLKYGLPNGIMHTVDMIAWTAFVFLIGTMSKEESAATNIAFTINLVSFLPLIGLGHGVEILVGRRQGEKNPTLSARTTGSALKVGLLYAVFVSTLYVVVPGWFLAAFASRAETDQWASLAPVVQSLLIFVGIYTVADTVNIIVSFALRGAGDTRFVAVLAVGLAWPLMVIPTYLAAQYGWGVYGAWVFASLYIASLAIMYSWRFRGGKWRTMQVVEQTVTDVTSSASI